MPNKIHNIIRVCKSIIRAAGFPAHVGRMQTWPRYMITIINVLYNIYYVYYINQYPTDPFNIINYYQELRNNIVSLNCFLTIHLYYYDL